MAKVFSSTSTKNEVELQDSRGIKCMDMGHYYANTATVDTIEVQYIISNGARGLLES